MSRSGRSSAQGVARVRCLLVAMSASLALSLLPAATAAETRPSTAQAQGAELLYSTYCLSCHSEQVHWRDRRVASDWPRLVKEVRRWQGNLGLQWKDEEINSVALYLNAQFYHFEVATR